MSGHLEQIRLDSYKPLRELVCEHIREAIINGVFAPGERLMEIQMADEMGVSRTPVREAFQELEGEGLITLRMNKGAIVNNIDRKFVQDIFEMRILLEAEAARKAAENGMETGMLLKRLNDMREHLDSLNVTDYETLNQEIHQSIWRAADNHQLTKYLQELWNGPSVGRGENAAAHHYQASTDEHIALLEAVRDRQPDAAEQAMRRHIGRSMENMLSHYPEE
jgi:DNA-binding GntR family transcriptional regulator